MGGEGKREEQGTREGCGRCLYLCEAAAKNFYFHGLEGEGCINPQRQGLGGVRHSVVEVLESDRRNGAWLSGTTRGTDDGSA